MSNLDAVKKVMLYQKDKSGFVKEPTVKEMADLVVLVLDAVKTIQDSIETKRLDIDKKYSQPVENTLAKLKTESESLHNQVVKEINTLISQGEDVLSQTTQQVREQVRQAIAEIQNGEDGIVSDEEIERAASIAYSMLELPDFDALISTQITSNGEAVRDALELLQGDNRYKVEIADVKGLADALNDLAKIRTANGGTIGKQQVYNFIRQAIADGTITGGTGGGHTIEDEGTLLTQRTNLNFVGAGVTVTDDAGNDATVVTIPGGGMTVTIPTGSINSSNTTYVSITEPKIIVTDYGTLVNEAIMQVAGIAGFTYTGTGPYNISVPMAPNNFIIVYS